MQEGSRTRVSAYRRKRAYAGRKLLAVGVAALLLVTVIWWVVESTVAGEVAGGVSGVIFSGGKGNLQKELEELRKNNEEAADFVGDYANRQLYLGQPIDLSEDYSEGEVPLLMQWDKRWGYDAYGESIIGLAGCGPTCLAMVYVHFTGDTDENPRTMAQFADENGYHTVGGTDWSLWTDGVTKLGLSGTTLPLDEGVMKASLNGGKVIVCSMRPGDFTTTGHFILITGYDEAGFYVNDPNRRSNSERQWTYDELDHQIKNLWEIGDAL